MKPTFTTSRWAVVGKINEEQFIKLSQAHKINVNAVSKGEDLSLPALNQDSINSSTRSDKKKTKKEEKIDAKIESMLEAYWNEDHEVNVMGEGKRELWEQYGFSESEGD